MRDAALRCEDIRAVGFFLFAAGWIIVVFASSGEIITDSLLIILGADILMAGLPAKQSRIPTREYSFFNLVF